jgi:hypothetical protein
MFLGPPRWSESMLAPLLLATTRLPARRNWMANYNLVAPPGTTSFDRSPPEQHGAEDRIELSTRHFR